MIGPSQFSRSSGPGGHNVNKVNTKVQLWLPIGAIVGLSEAAVASDGGCAV